MHHILLYELVDDYLESRAEHLQLGRQAKERGELVLAGAALRSADEAVLVFRGESLAAPEALAKAERYVRNGLMKSWRVRK